MKTLKTLFDLITPTAPETEIDGRASRIRLAILAIGATAACAAVYGLGVGSTDFTQAAANLLKVPAVMLIPLIFSWPIAALTSKFMGTPLKGSDLVLSQSIGLFGASLVLAVLAPIVALFYHTTATLGGAIALLTAVMAAIVGFCLFFRATHQRQLNSRGAIPAIVATIFYAVSSLQVIVLASPILVESTRLAEGVQGLF